MKINKVLLDTCFLIELADKNKPCHKNAKDYFDYFNKHNIPYYLSPIVVAEYWQNDLVNDFPINSFRHLSFNITEGRESAILNKRLVEHKDKLNENASKACIKDDIKILSHLIVTNDIDCFITKDTQAIDNYINPLKSFYPAFQKLKIFDINNPCILEPQLSINFSKE